MSPQWSLVAFAAIFGAGYFLGRENGIYRTERAAARRRHLSNVANRHRSERGAADLYALLWAAVGAWSLALAVVYLGGFK